MPAPIPKVICFDLGGVLIAHCRSWPEGCACADVPLRDGDWVMSEAALERRREVVQVVQRGQCTAEQYYARMVDVLGGRYTAQEVERVHAAWLLDEYRGVESLVRELNADPRVTTACLSNTNAMHWEQMFGAAGLQRYPSLTHLEIRLASHLLDAAKPDPEIYALALPRLGVRPDEILFFDDGPANVEAAREAGWRAELIDFRGDTAAQLREHLARHLPGA